MTSSCAYKPVGPPKGAVARLLSLGEPSWAWELRFLDSWPFLHWDPRSGSVARIVHKIPDGPIYAGKTRIWASKPGFPWKFLGFSENFLDFLGNSLENCKMDLSKMGSRWILGEGNTPSLTTDEPFQAQLASQRPRRPPRPPDQTPRRF